MNANKATRAFAIAVLGLAVSPATAAPPQIRTAPRPIMQNPNGPRIPAPRPDPQAGPPPVEQYTSLAITVSTGQDDLRSDSNAMITIYYPDNSQQTCNLKSSEQTLDNGSTTDAPQCVFPVPKTLDQLKQSEIMLSFDGTGGVGTNHTYDNWNVVEVRVEAENSLQHLQKCLLDVSKAPYLVRMTGNQRTYSLSAAPNSC